MSSGTGLNQLTPATPGGGQTSVPTLNYDTRGNLITSGTSGYTYSSEKLLLTGPSSATLSYDLAMRLYQSVGGGVTTRFLYDGTDMIAEYNASNVLQRRYVHGPGTDELILWYEGSVLTGRRWFHADERGSVGINRTYARWAAIFVEIPLDFPSKRSIGFMAHRRPMTRIHLTTADGQALVSTDGMVPTV